MLACLSPGPAAYCVIVSVQDVKVFAMMRHLLCLLAAIIIAIKFFSQPYKHCGRCYDDARKLTTSIICHWQGHCNNLGLVTQTSHVNTQSQSIYTAFKDTQKITNKPAPCACFSKLDNNLNSKFRTHTFNLMVCV